MIDIRTAPYAALILRVSLGVLFLAHGLWMKVLTFGIPGTVGYFESLGYPGFFAHLVILGEVGGGLALILGLWTRAISVVFSNPNGGWEFPVFWIAALIVQALLGPGAWALKPDVILSAGTPNTAAAR